MKSLTPEEQAFLELEKVIWYFWLETEHQIDCLQIFLN